MNRISSTYINFLEKYYFVKSFYLIPMYTRIRRLPQLGFTPIFKGEGRVIFMATSAWSPGNKVLK